MTSRLLPLIILTFMVIGIPFAVNVANQPLRSRSTQAAPPMEALAYFESSTDEVMVGNQISIELKVDTGVEVIGGVFGSVEYDASKLQLVNASSGSFFSDLLLNPGNAKINLSATEKVAGTGTVMKMLFLAKEDGEATIFLSPHFEVLDSKGEVNILKSSLQPKKLIITTQ